MKMPRGIRSRACEVEDGGLSVEVEIKWWRLWLLALESLVKAGDNLHVQVKVSK